MTRVVDGITVYTFDEWRKKADRKEWIEKQLENAEVCETCEGEKTHECDCGDVHDCCACDATGTYSDFDPRNEYERTLRNEIKRLQEYIAKQAA